MIQFLPALQLALGGTIELTNVPFGGGAMLQIIVPSPEDRFSS